MLHSSQHMSRETTPKHQCQDPGWCTASAALHPDTSYLPPLITSLATPLTHQPQSAQSTQLPSQPPLALSTITSIIIVCNKLTLLISHRPCCQPASTATSESQCTSTPTAAAGGNSRSSRESTHLTTRTTCAAWAHRQEALQILFCTPSANQAA